MQMATPYSGAALLCAHFANALPASDHLLGPRDVDCTGIADIPYNDSCWVTLNMTSWMKNWNTTTPRCNNTADGTNCCGPDGNKDEPWSRCFLRLALGDADYDCTQINLQSCSLEGFQLDSRYKASEWPQLRYAVRNIYAINNLFNTWYTAVQYATTQAALVIEPIITEIDPEKKTNVLLGDILLAFMVGLALLGPEVSVLLDGAVEAAEITATVATAAKVVTAGVQQAPGVGRAIWPSGTTESQSVQIGDLEAQLGTLKNNLSTSINSGLLEIMSDVPSFLAFAGTGSFSGSSMPSLPAQTESLNIGFKTYLLTTAMSQNSWRGSWTNLDVSAVGNSTSALASQQNAFGCNFQANGVCVGNGHDNHKDSWAEWPSPQSNRAWVMDQCCHKNDPTSAGLTQSILTNGWADLGLVFDGGYNCTGAAGSRQGAKPVVDISDDGVLDLSCVSQLPIMIGCNEACPVAPTNGSCAFIIWDGC